MDLGWPPYLPCMGCPQCLTARFMEGKRSLRGPKFFKVSLYMFEQNCYPSNFLRTVHIWRQGLYVRVGFLAAVVNVFQRNEATILHDGWLKLS